MRSCCGCTRPRDLELKSAVGFRGDLSFQYQDVPQERISLVTPVIHRGPGQRMAGGVRDRAGTVEFLRGGIGARARRCWNCRQPRRLGLRADAQEHRSGRNQKELPCRFHGMIKLFLFFECQRTRQHLERAEDFNAANQRTLHIIRLPP